MRTTYVWLAAFFLSLNLLLVPHLVAANEQDLVIGYLELKKDPRYSKKRLYSRFLTQPLGRPFPGAEVALKEVKYHGKEAGITFKLERITERDGEALAAALLAQHESGVNFFIIDAPADIVASLAAATKGRDLVLFNVSARDDALRQGQCQANLFHIIPNHAMLMDALVQYLVSRKWNKALVLVGPEPEDQLWLSAFERATKRYGAKITDTREFVLSNDPREREKNNVRLLSGGKDYDVVFIADSVGEFAREVSYRTIKPRLVVGSEGMTASAWHWAWERHGAPQLEKRFEKLTGRAMRSVDWAAWLAVKSVAEAVQRSKSAVFADLHANLVDQDVVIDTFKGNRSSFRRWDNQLRQPLLLITHNWVIERAPIEGFLHKTNELDTLGFDERDSVCAP